MSGDIRIKVCGIKYPANRKDIGKTTDNSIPGSEAVETTHPPTAKTPSKTLGATPATDATILRTEQGGARC